MKINEFSDDSKKDTLPFSNIQTELNTFSREAISNKAEMDLHESEVKYRNLIELIPDMIFVQTEGIFVLINPAGVKLLGAETENDILGRHVLELVHPDDYEAIKSRIRKNNEEKVDVPLREARYRRLDGSFTWVEVAAKPITYQGKPGALVVARNINDRKIAEEKLSLTLQELERSNKELEQFAYVSSHDLQEPLRMVTSYAQLFSKKYKGNIDLKADEYLDFIIDGTRRMQALISDLLLIARVSSNTKNFIPTDFNLIIGDLIKDLQLIITDRGVNIKYCSLPTLYADPVQIRQLFQNLLSNAIKFNDKDKPEIEISAVKREDEWQFSVGDNGIGISDEYFEKIFVIFQRLHAREEYSGTGIGLTICKKIIECHGGRIWVESDPGKGTAFHFTLPGSADKPE